MKKAELQDLVAGLLSRDYHQASAAKHADLS